MKYGGNRTIHKTGYVDVETDSKGNVVSVWFRCLMLPFKQTKVDETRAREMGTAYKSDCIIDIEEIEIKDRN